MFGIGLPEAIVILVICLLVFDVKSLPRIAKSLGKAVNEFRKAQRSITDDDKLAG
jgi:TatA/E family protein of Tat protein translocase